jgi:hypothetical protein
VSEILAPVRVCSRCKEPKPLDAFRLDPKGYRRSHCNLCALAVTQEWRARNREALLARRRAAYPTRDGGHPHRKTSRSTAAPSLSSRADGFPTPCDGGETP